MEDSKFIFVVLRHVESNEQNNLWIECYKSIRYFYKNKIIIIDNGSNYSFIKYEIELINCEVINSEYPYSRLFSPFFELLKIKNYRKAIIIHDGTIFQKFIDFSLFYNVKYLWHFNVKKYDNINLMLRQINVLQNNTKLLETFRKGNWVGCMGSSTAISEDFLNNLENIYKISLLKDIIKDKDNAIAFERVLGILCFSLYDNIIYDLSYEGEIKDMVWGYSYSDFINKNHLFEQIEWDTNNKKIINTNEKHIIKIFMGR